MFLNLIGIAKFLGRSKLRKELRLPFILCFLAVRVPVFAFILHYLKRYNKEIMAEGKIRGILYYIAMICGFVLQFVWAVLITRKLIEYGQGTKRLISVNA